MKISGWPTTKPIFHSKNIAMRHKDLSLTNYDKYQSGVHICCSLNSGTDAKHYALNNNFSAMGENSDTIFDYKSVGEGVPPSQFNAAHKTFLNCFKLQTPTELKLHDSTPFLRNNRLLFHLLQVRSFARNELCETCVQLWKIVSSFLPDIVHQIFIFLFFHTNNFFLNTSYFHTINRAKIFCFSNFTLSTNCPHTVQIECTSLQLQEEPF